MRIRLINFIIPVLLLSTITHAQDSNNQTPLSAAKAWWNATTFGDTSFIKRNSTEELTVTFNNGRSFTRTEFVAQVATHNSSARIKSEWSNELVQTTTPNTAVVTNRIVETVGAMAHIYKFITVLVNKDSQWKVAAAQSTRELELAPPFPIDEPDKLKDYTGSYRTPGGIILKIVLSGISLVLVEPSGQETRLAAIGHDLFEIPQILSAGNVRFSFSRNRTGKVISMIRITNKIATMPRID